MAKNELSKLKRGDLLELMVEQGREIDRLREELENAQKKLNSKELMLQEAGSISKASVGISNVFEEAQTAAEIYIYNVKRICKKTASEQGLDIDWESFDRIFDELFEKEKIGIQKNE